MYTSHSGFGPGRAPALSEEKKRVGGRREQLDYIAECAKSRLSRSPTRVLVKSILAMGGPGHRVQREAATPAGQQSGRKGQSLASGIVTLVCPNLPRAIRIRLVVKTKDVVVALLRGRMPKRILQA
jgi:hypothetical protein